MERKIVGIKKIEKINNNKLRSLTKMVDVDYLIKKKKFKFVRHLVRVRKKVLARRAIKRESLRIRWEDEIKEQN